MNRSDCFPISQSSKFLINLNSGPILGFVNSRRYYEALLKMNSRCQARRACWPFSAASNRRNSQILAFDEVAATMRWFNCELITIWWVIDSWRRRRFGSRERLAGKLSELSTLPGHLIRLECWFWPCTHAKELKDYHQLLEKCLIVSN
jgi:hypothetical protein